MAGRPGSEPDVFLSYSREDSAKARRFAEALEAQGLKVWWDADLRSGEAYDEVTEHALRSAKAVVVLWSKRSVGSRWVRAEATAAHRNKTLVPAMIEPCERPVMFELTQTADLSHWNGDSSDRAWRAYLSDVRRFVDGGNAGEIPLHAAGSEPAVGGVPSMAVLPLVSRSRLPEDREFAEVLTEELISTLALNGYFRVIASGSAAAFRGHTDDPRMIGRELGARYVLVGQLRRAESDFRLMFQLIDSETGGILCSTRHTYPVGASTTEQDEHVNAIATGIADQLLRIEFDHAMKKEGGLTAWEHVLRAMASFSHLGPQGSRIGIEEARKAVSIAPDFGLAHALVAVGLATAMFVSGKMIPDVEREVRACIKRALELDGENPNVLSVTSGAARCVGDAAAALRYAQRAAEIGPRLPNVQYHLGASYLTLGRTREALAAFDDDERYARQGTPLRYITVYMRALALMMEGRVEEADSALDRSLLLNPHFPLALKWKAATAAMLGKTGEASAAVRNMLELDPKRTLAEHEAQTLLTLPDKDLCAKVNAALRSVWADAD